MKSWIEKSIFYQEVMDKKEYISKVKIKETLILRLRLEKGQMSDF
jgi:hypothetical protein